MIRNARRRAKAKDIPFTIVFDDINIPEKCPALGIPLMTHKGGGRGGRSYSPSLDRIVPELGYVPDNVVVVSQLANSIKSSGAWREIYAVADFYYELERKGNEPTLNNIQSHRRGRRRHR